MLFGKSKKADFKPLCAHCDAELDEILIAAYQSDSKKQEKLALRSAPAESGLPGDVHVYVCPSCKKMLAVGGATYAQNIGAIEIKA